MRLTPLDIREQQFRRVMRGLDPEEVEGFLSNVASEFESLVAGNNELRQRVLELEEKIGEYKTMEKALRDALLAAERVMGEAKESAQREASLIVREAEMAAERAKGRLSQELVQMQQDLSELRRLKDAYLTRVRWLLRSHLEMIDGHATEFTEVDLSFGPRPVAPPSPEAPSRYEPQSPSRHEPEAASRYESDAPSRYEPEAPSRPARFGPGGSFSPPEHPAIFGEDPNYGPAEGPARQGEDPSYGTRERSPRFDPGTGPGSTPRGGPRASGTPDSTGSEPPPPPPFGEEWQVASGRPPFAGSPAVDLDDVLRPVGPDGTYDPGPTGYPPAGRPATSEEIAQAARRAERLAAEARAALERHSAPPASSDAWNVDRSREGPGGRG